MKNQDDEARDKDNQTIQARRRSIWANRQEAHQYFHTYPTKTLELSIHSMQKKKNRIQASTEQPFNGKTEPSQNLFYSEAESRGRDSVKGGRFVTDWFLELSNIFFIKKWTENFFGLIQA